MVTDAAKLFSNVSGGDMRFLLGLVIVLGAAVLGGLMPLLFSGSMSTGIGANVVCAMFNAGGVSAETRSLMIAAAMNSPNVDAKSKEIVGRATPEGCKIQGTR